MKKAVFFVLLTFLMLALSGAAQAQEPVESSGWQATYWNNVALTGEPALTRSETEIDYDWGLGSPYGLTVEPNRFSARWTRTLFLPAGRYRFRLTVDDGARLWVDGRLLIDEWRVQTEQTYVKEIYLSGGDVPITLEYFENAGAAVAKLSWTPITDFTDNWTAEYFNNKTLSGSPVLIRGDAAIDFDWGEGSPAAGIIDPEAFSARWTRDVTFSSGRYRFTTTVDDGVRLWVDGQLLIDSWQSQPATTYEAEISLTAGSIPLKVEYYENGGLAEAHLSWSRIGERPAPGPGTLIDDTASGFARGGPETDWQSEPEGYNTSLTWTRNSETVAADYNWARWYPQLTPGVYEVAVYIPERFSTTSQARYWISHANDYTLRVVDQSANGGRWVTLGTFEFQGSANDFVSLADVTFEEEGSSLVAYDAVRWTPVSAASQAEVIANPTVVSPGVEVTVTGTDFPPGQPISLELGVPDAEPFGRYGQTTVGAAGSVVMTFTMPARRPSGEIIDVEELVILLITEDGTKATTTLTFRPFT